MFKHFLFVTFTFLMVFNATAQNQKSKSFFDKNDELEKQTNQIFESLSETARVAQMIVTSAGELGKPNKTVIKLARENKIGGVVFLKGIKENHTFLMDSLNAINQSQNQLPLLYSIDAEPSLFNSRLPGTPPMVNTIDIKTVSECDSVVKIINQSLLEVGFHQNFAPVVDISPKNEAIKNRSFGNDKEQVIALSKQFISTTQSQGLVATAKHFPGHGLVTGDTHKKSVYIDGPLQEIDIYPPLIESGVISIMVAHITIKNNPDYQTDGLPSSCSRKIVTDLLKDELGFKGLIITDALNIMKAVTVIEDAPLLASKAGNDMLLMPINETTTINSILEEMAKDDAYKAQVYASVKKIIRLKLYLGLIEAP